MSDLKVIVLGSSATIPTESRNLPAIVIKRKGEILLFDAGEGTQLQFMKKKISLFKISRIFITHLHGDHVTGIPGILMSLSLYKRTIPLSIFGPIGINNYIQSITKTIIFDLTFNLNVIEITQGLILETSEYKIECIPGEHVVPCLVYGLFEKERRGKIKKDKLQQYGIKPGPHLRTLRNGQDYISSNGKKIPARELVGPNRPGRKIVYTGDTRPTERILEFCKNSDLLICDGTFKDEHAMLAIKGGHCTISEAIQLAKKANVK
ncbi:MAG: ribonuclease Z, partial [Candidatus Helarchaeota archaeon]